MADAAEMSAFKWETLPEKMPNARVFSTPVELDGKLYVIGGCDARGQPVDNLEVYDPVKKEWSELKKMPTKRAGTCAVGIGQNIIVMGGVSM